MLVFDNFAIFLKCFCWRSPRLVILLCLITGIPDTEDSADFLCLLLGATLGMSIMASANHLLMIFIGIEMASLPSYALAGFLKGRRQSSEASLKYVVYGGGAAGIMLYGISLLAGKFGTGLLARPAALHGHDVARPDGPLGNAFCPHRHRLQAGGRAVSFLVPGRVRRRLGGSGGVSCRWHPKARLWRCWDVSPSGLAGLTVAERQCRGLEECGALFGAGARVLRCLDYHIRQPGRLSANQSQTPAGLFDHRACRLHDDGPGDA